MSIEQTLGELADIRARMRMMLLFCEYDKAEPGAEREALRKRLVDAIAGEYGHAET